MLHEVFNYVTDQWRADSEEDYAYEQNEKSYMQQNSLKHEHTIRHIYAENEVAHLVMHRIL